MATQLTAAQKTRIGLFFSAGTALLFLVMALFFGARLFRHEAVYKVRFAESVSGLEEGSPVRYLGLALGQVARMRVAEDDPKAIEVTLQLDPKQPLYLGTTAVIDGSGLMGAKTINLRPGDRRRGQLEEGAMLPAASSLFGQLEDHATAIVTDVRRVADQLVRWASDDNRERVESLVVQMTSLARTVDSTLQTERKPLHHLLESSASAAGEIAETARASRTLIADMHKMVDQLTQQTIATLEAWQRPVAGVDGKEVAATLRSLHATVDRLGDRLGTNEAGQAIKSFTATVDHVDHLVGDLDLTVQAGREDLTATLGYLRQAAEDLREFSRMLANNPSVLVRGRKDLP